MVDNGKPIEFANANSCTLAIVYGKSLQCVLQDAMRAMGRYERARQGKSRYRATWCYSSEQ